MKKTERILLIVIAALAMTTMLFSPMVGGACEAETIRIQNPQWFDTLESGETKLVMTIEVTNANEGDVILIAGMTDKYWDCTGDKQLWNIGSAVIEYPKQIGRNNDVWITVGQKLTVFVPIEFGSCPDTAEVCGDASTGAKLMRLTAMLVDQSTAEKILKMPFNSEIALYKLGAMTTKDETCIKRPCGEAEQVVEVEEPEVWIPSPRQGENIGRDTTEIDVFWKSKGTEYYTIIGLGSTNQPWDWPKGIVYNMDCDDGSKFSGKMTFFVGSCKDTEDGNGKGANKEYIEIIAVKDEDVEKVENLGCSFEREKVKPFIRASYSIWVDRPCGCCGQIQ